MNIDRNELMRTSATEPIGGGSGGPAELKSIDNSELSNPSHKPSHKVIPPEFDQFRAWAASHPSIRAQRCVLHLNCLELNMPDPDPVLIEAALRDFRKLECRS